MQLAYLECEHFNDRTFVVVIVFVALVISVKKDSNAVSSKVSPYLGAHLTNAHRRTTDFSRERALCVLVFNSGVTGNF